MASGGTEGSLVQQRLLRSVHERVKQISAIEQEERKQVALARLYEDVAGEVAPTVKAELHKEGKIHSVSERLHFYEVLSYALEHERALARSLVQTFVSLWGNLHAAASYALLLHRYVLTLPANVGIEGEQALDGLHRLCNVTASSCTRLFSHDMIHMCERFKPLHSGVARMASSAQLVEALPDNARKELFACILQFLPYYESSGGVNQQLARLRLLHVPSDEVLDQLTLQLNNIRAEEPLAFFLRRLKSLEGTFVLDSARLPSVLLFQRAIYSLTTPGGPVYPPRSVRHAAIEALDTLFPRGRRFRRGVNLYFRLWRPKYVPGSLSNYVVSKGKKVHELLRRNKQPTS